MSWERDPLWAKARLFIEKAIEFQRDDPSFGLWCSFGLEILARAAIANISPVLLAEPDKEHKYLLHAIGRGSNRVARKSIDTARVINLCHELIESFTKENLTVCLALVNRRNEELHTGAAAFAAYPTNLWIAGFYSACESLCASIGETMESLFGEDEAKVAKSALEGDRNDTKQRVLTKISSHKSVFESKPEPERELALAVADKEANGLAYQGYHRVKCPACGGTAIVKGNAFGKEIVSDQNGDIAVRQAVSPNFFACSACQLKLEGYAELEVCGLGGHYTRRTTFTPSEYYGLIEPDDLPYHIEEYLAANMREYDNE
nr:hypothetical protein [Desulfobacula sp.]